MHRVVADRCWEGRAGADPTGGSRAFGAGEKNREIAAVLRVSERSVEHWRQQWRERESEGLLSKGSPGCPRLTESQVARLERTLAQGPLAHGWTDHRWTLVRVKTLIGRVFRISYTVEGTWRLRRRGLAPAAACPPRTRAEQRGS
ncbi:helix-turn-helix domain-containing protein [Streptomyces sp. KLMMK]